MARAIITITFALVVEAFWYGQLASLHDLTSLGEINIITITRRKQKQGRNKAEIALFLASFSPHCHADVRNPFNTLKIVLGLKYQLQRNN